MSKIRKTSELLNVNDDHVLELQNRSDAASAPAAVSYLYVYIA